MFGFNNHLCIRCKTRFFVFDDMAIKPVPNEVKINMKKIKMFALFNQFKRNLSFFKCMKGVKSHINDLKYLNISDNNEQCLKKTLCEEYLDSFQILRFALLSDKIQKSKTKVNFIKSGLVNLENLGYLLMERDPEHDDGIKNAIKFQLSNLRVAVNHAKHL